MFYHHRLSQFSTQSYGPFGLAGTSNTDSDSRERGTEQQDQPPSRSHAANIIGNPISFVSGQFAGNTVRAELHEIQKADLGRKWVSMDCSRSLVLTHWAFSTFTDMHELTDVPWIHPLLLRYDCSTSQMEGVRWN